AVTEKNPTLKARTPSAPKPFDLALGAQLAALSSTGGDEGGPMTVQGKKITVAPPPSEPPPPAPPRSAQQPVAMLPLVNKPPTTDLTAMIPRRNYAMVAAAIVAVAIVLAVVVGFMRVLTRPPPPAPTPRAELLPPPAPVATPHEPAKESADVAVADPARVHHPRRPQAARLSVSSDVEAKLFVDGKYVRQTPVDGLELEPGRHTVRVEGTDRGLFLVPKEETVELKAGEAKRLAVELK